MKLLRLITPFLCLASCATAFFVGKNWPRVPQSKLFEATAAAANPGGRSSSETKTPPRTLYEVLGASPTETREELKKRYVELARKSHPDALVGAAGDDNENALDFAEIAAAWRILGDTKERKRYDRSMQAERLSNDIVAWAGNVTVQARPAADFGAELFEKVAIPFLRRTTATTLASFRAATSASNSESGAQTQDLGKTFQTAMDAARRAGEAVDKMELLEKADEFESQAVNEYTQAMELQTKLKELVDHRLQLSLHTPRSGLTSCEALILLEEYNQTVADHLSVWDRARLRNTVETEIKQLQSIENDFVEAQKLDSKCQEDYRDVVRERLVARRVLSKAEKEVEAARKAYEASQKKVLECRGALDSVTRELVNSEAQAKKSSYDMERRSAVVEQQAEKVRHALRQKEREVFKRKGSESSPLEDASSEDERMGRLKELESMRNEERRLAEMAAQMEAKASRLFSRSNDMKLQAKRMGG